MSRSFCLWWCKTALQSPLHRLRLWKIKNHLTITVGMLYCMQTDPRGRVLSNYLGAATPE